MHALWSRWAPPLERSKLVTIAYSGSYVGTVVSMGVCGLLAEHLGWASIFYVAGIREYNKKFKLPRQEKKEYSSIFVNDSNIFSPQVPSPCCGGFYGSCW